MPSVWSTENKFKLLLIIINSQEIISPNWQSVAEKMGGDFNWNGCRYDPNVVELFTHLILASSQAYQKLRKDDNADGANKDDDAGQKKATPLKTPATSKKRKTADGNFDRDDDEVDTPTKKRVKQDVEQKMKQEVE